MCAKLQYSQDVCNSTASSLNCDSPYLDTIGQSGTNPEDFVFDLVSQTSKDDRKTLLKRARRKTLGDALKISLVDASRQNKKSELFNAYWISYNCGKVFTEDSTGKVKSRYCKYRWCPVCNAIRTAQLIKQYKPVFEAWNDVYFVTLTKKAVGADSLSGSLYLMMKTFKKIHERYKKQHQRGQGERFKGFRKIEITYNPDENTFHCHFHFFVQGEARARQLIEDWLMEFNDESIANRKAQKAVKANENAVLELFKYSTKLISGKPGKDGRLIYSDALDIIFNVLKGKRTFQSFGFEANDRTRMQSAVDEMANAVEVEKEDVTVVAEWHWQKEISDWVNEATGEVLANHVPGEWLKLMCEERIIFRRGHDWTPAKLQLKQKDSVITPARRSPKLQLRKEPICNVLISPGTARRARKAAGIGLKDKEIIVIPFGTQSNCKPATHR